jgi:small neutral amino acid transporter SnatA (MarC family)
VEVVEAVEPPDQMPPITQAETAERVHFRPLRAPLLAGLEVVAVMVGLQAQTEQRLQAVARVPVALPVAQAQTTREAGAVPVRLPAVPVDQASLSWL